MLSHKFIKIRGARTYNLKNVNLDIPINKLTCITGPSGSGKSSLAFHTLLLESKRRFLNSLPNDVKFFWNMPQSADVDKIEPVLPVWGLAQSNPIIGSRPNVADLIGLSEPLQKYFFDFSLPGCSVHGIPYSKKNDHQELERFFLTHKVQELSYWHVFLRKDSFKVKWPKGPWPSRTFNDKEGVRDFLSSDEYWEIFRFKSKGLESDLKKVVKKIEENGKLFEYFFVDSLNKRKFWFRFSEEMKCLKCERGIDQAPRAVEFSPYNAAGACLDCSGHGMILKYSEKKIIKNPYLSINDGAIHLLNSSRFQSWLPIVKREIKKRGYDLNKPFREIEDRNLWDYLWEGNRNFPGFHEFFCYLESKKYKKNVRIYLRSFQEEVLCKSCGGCRLSSSIRGFLLPLADGFVSYQELLQKTVSDFLNIFCCHLESIQNKYQVERGKSILSFLKSAEKLNLQDLGIWRKAKALTASEYQRSLLCKILSYKGSGSLFVLDEPSLGLGLSEQKSIFDCLQNLKKQGNTIILVEHSEFLKSRSDFLVEMGPGAGALGGEIVKSSVPKKVRMRSVCRKIEKKSKYRLSIGPFCHEGLKLKKVFFPAHSISLVTGNSGVDKSTLMFKKIANSLYFLAYGEPYSSPDDIEKNVRSNFEFTDVHVFEPGVRRLSGRSTVGTLTGFSSLLRNYFTNLPVSRSLNLEKGHFSSNSELGRCPTCEGRGIVQIEMSFMEDMVLTCEDCKGMKLRPFYATISDGKMMVVDALNLPMEKIIPEIPLTPKYQRLWQYINELKLDYLSIDRSLVSLSGGERQRVRLLANLQKDIKDSLLFFENLSAGLSPLELASVGRFLQDLTLKKNTVILIDQNPFFFNIANSIISFPKDFT